MYSLFDVLSACFDRKIAFTWRILSRALGALGMRILKVMKLSMMHKDHSLQLSPYSCILDPLVAHTSRLNSSISAGSAFKQCSNTAYTGGDPAARAAHYWRSHSAHRRPKESVVSVGTFTSRQPGRKHAEIKYTNTPASSLTTGRLFSCFPLGFAPLVFFSTTMKTRRSSRVVALVFPELGQAAILLSNKGISKYTEYPRFYSTQTTNDSAYLLIHRSLIHAINPIGNCLAQPTMKRLPGSYLIGFSCPSYSQMTLCTTRRSVCLRLVFTNVVSAPRKHVSYYTSVRLSSTNKLT